MVRKSIQVRIHDILDAIDGIRETEASRHIPPEMKEWHPEVPWQDIASIGNILRHEYAKIDDRIVWNVTRKNLEALERAVRHLAAGKPSD